LAVELVLEIRKERIMKSVLAKILKVMPSTREWGKGKVRNTIKSEANRTVEKFDKQLADLQEQTEMLFGKDPPEIKPSFASHGGIIYIDMPLDSNGVVIETDDKVDYTMESAQAKAINRAIAKTGGNISQAARLLGIERGTIYNQIKAENNKKKIA